MKKIFKTGKAKGKITTPEPAGDAEFDAPGYSLKEKDLPKLHKSAWSGELVKVQQLSKKGDVNQLDKGNRTALHLACAQNHKEVAAFLVSNKAKLNLCDNDQRSPLMKAAQGNHVACVETLLRSSADPNLVDKDGNTALHLSARGGFVDVVLLMLKGGAMVNAPNKKGSTPLHLCTEAKQDVMAEVLLDNDADVNATDNNNRTALMLACQSDQIGLVKLLLERKADTEIKDSKGWTANDQAIMAGYHGCSHLIDEAHSSRRPRSAVGRPGSSMFGSTAGSEGVGLGFSLGGGSARDEYDDDEDELSVGKDSFGEDSWGASASEADEPVKPKPKVSKAVKLSKFIIESDDESVRSGDVSQQSTASKSRIPRAVSKDSLASNRSAPRGAGQDASSSKIPRLAGTKGTTPTSATNSPKSAGKARVVNDPYPWDDTPTPTPRDDTPPPYGSAATPRGGPLTPKSSGLSFGESGSEWDDDDVLGALEGTSPKKMTNITEEKRSVTGKPTDQTEKRPLSSQDKQQRKDVLNKLGMSDVDDDDDDDSSLHFTDDEPKKPSLVKSSLQLSPIIKAEDSPDVLKTPAADEEDEESDWDSDNDLLPSNGSDVKDPPVIRPGDSGIQTNSDSLASKSKPALSPRVERKLPPTPAKEVLGKGGDSKEAGQGGAGEDARRQEEQDREEVDEDDDDDDWDSEDENEEEESEWEKALKRNRRASVHEELKQAQKTEASRQQQWEKEEAEREEKRKQEAEAELRREQEEIERERQQREEEEREEREREEEERREKERRETQKKKEEEKTRQEAEKREREEAEQKRREEERRAAEEKKRQEEQLKLEKEKKEKQIEAERQLEERRKKEDEERKAAEEKKRKMEEERLKKMEQEMQKKHKEEERLLEERRKQEEAEREEREEKLRQEMEKMKTVEERNEAERLHLEKERKRLEEERLRKEEDKKRQEMETKMELERIEAERAKLDAERRMMEEKQEEDRKRIEDMQRSEKQKQEEAKKKQNEERRRNEDERQRLEEEKEELKTLRLQQEEARQRLEDDKKREEDRRKFDEERIKREEERLEMERKRIEEEAKKRKKELLQGMSSKSEGEKKQLEAELQRLEEERQHEIQRKEEEFEEEKRRQAAEKSALQKELELQSQRFKEERQKFESRQKEAEQQKQLMESQRKDELKKINEERMREMEQMKKEKLRLQKENQDIERKWQEIKELKQEAEKKESERYLQRYQKSIEKRLQDEESNDGVTADGDHDHDHSSDIDANLHEMEVAVLRQDVRGTSPVLAGSRRRNTNMNNGLDSQGNTAEFNQGLIGHNPQNPLHSTAARSLRITHNTLTNGNPHGLYSKPPAWQAILNEPDGLDSSSTDEDDDDIGDGGPATAEELRASFLSPYLTSTPQGLNTNQNAGGTTPADDLSDPVAVVRLQGQLREQKRIADREKGLRANAENHCKALEGDIDEMHRRIDEANSSKVAFEQQVLDLEACVRTLEHELSQELEKRHNAEVILEKTKEQLLRKEEQYSLEIEAKQKTELGSRNLSLELRTAQNLVRQFEEERDELRSQLLQEKHARALQEELVQDQLHAQDVLHQETSRFFAEKAEAVSRLEAADESRKNVLNQSDRLKTELNALKVELERQRMRHRDDQGMLSSENEELASKIEELKNEIRVSEEALAHATMAFNSQLMAVKTENAMLHGAVEKEMNKTDKLQTKLESVERRLQSTSQELESSQQARSELERSFQRDREEWSRGRDRLEAEVISLREAAQVASKKYALTESKLRNLEKELQVTSTSLMERSNQLTSLQRELDSRNTRQSSHDTLLQKEKEDNYKISARMESLMERLNDSQNEVSKLRRSLETAQQDKMQRDKDLLEAQEKFNNTLKTLQAENDRMRSVWEERVSTSSDNISRLKEELQRSEHNRSLRDQEIRQIQQELTDALRKLSIAEANLDLARKTQNELDKEKRQQAHHMKQLQDQMSSVERDRRSLEARIEDLQSDLMQTQRNNLNTSQQLMVTQTSLQKKSVLEERLRDLEAENSQLAAAVRQEKEKGNILEREIQDSNKMRVSLEDLVSNLQTTSMRMEGKLQEETANRSLFAKEAEDHKGLWELEIAQLERAKTEVQAQVDEEKRKVRKMAELKRSYEERWQSEVQRTQLQEQEINTLKAKLKMAKKRLKDLDAPELHLNTLQTGFERERLNMEAAVATQRRQIDDLNQQLEREAALRADVEKQNRLFQQELSSAKTHEKGKDKLEKAKRKLEEELTQMKLVVQQNFIEKGELEKYKQQLDAKARMELNEKLDQVNTYLEEQSQAREKLEVLRNSNENELRKEQENTINDLKNEIGRLRSSYHDMLAQKETMLVEVARFKELYQDAVKKQDKLTTQLDKAQDRLVDTQAKFTLQKQRNRQMLDGSLDLSPSHLPKKQAPSPHIDSITEKVWSELDKSITRHLQAAPTDLGSSLAELRASALSRSYDGYKSPLRQENNQYLATLRNNYFV